MSAIEHRSIRYRAVEDTELATTITKLNAQKWSGRATVDFNGSRIDFNSPRMIEEMIVELENEIARREALAAGKTKRRSWLFTPSMPDGKGYL